MEGLFSLLPMPFWLGPPLPAFLKIHWPWVGQDQSQSVAPLNFIKGIGEALPSLPKMATQYENTEQWTWVDYRGRERKITVHRNARQG